MQRKMRLIVMIPWLALGCAPGTDEPGSYRATMVMLPEGRPEAGREAFLVLGCASCHTVAWDPDLPPPVSKTPGPTLGLDPSKLGPGGLATSIVAPSHKVAERYRRAEGPPSPMTDFSGTMTIRQLSDVVAYLERQGLETQAKSGQTPG